MAAELCPYCEQPLDNTRPWQPALEGGGAHFDCLETNEHDEEEHGRDND